MRNTEVTFKIVESIAVITKHETGWTKEVNKVAWNGNPPKYDVRDWSPDHTMMGRGITLTEGEMKALIEGVVGHEADDEGDNEEPEEDPDDEPEGIEAPDDGVVKIVNASMGSKGTMTVDIVSFLENRNINDLRYLVNKVIKPAINRDEVVVKIKALLSTFLLDNMGDSKREQYNHKKAIRMTEFIGRLA